MMRRRDEPPAAGFVWLAADRPRRHRALGQLGAAGSLPVLATGGDDGTGKLEVYPDCDLLCSLGSGDPEFEPAARGGTVLAICSMLMRVHVAGVELTDIAASTLGHHLARHMLAHYCHVRPPYGEAGAWIG